MSWLCWLLSEDPVACYPTGPSCSSIQDHHPFHLILVSSHFVLMMDDANGFRLIHQRHDFQYVHYVVHGRESSAMIIWPHDPVAVVVLCDVAVAVVGMILLSLASFFLVLRVHVSPKCFWIYFFFKLWETKRKKNWKVKKPTEQ